MGGDLTLSCLSQNEKNRGALIGKNLGGGGDLTLSCFESIRRYRILQGTKYYTTYMNKYCHRPSGSEKVGAF